MHETTVPLSRHELTAMRERVGRLPAFVYRCQFADKDGADADACGSDGETLDCSRDQCHHPLRRVQAAVIVAARSDIPRLLAEVERLKKLVGE